MIAFLRRCLGLFPRDCDHLPLVHTGYTHERDEAGHIDWSRPMTTLSPPGTVVADTGGGGAPPYGDTP